MTIEQQLDNAKMLLKMVLSEGQRVDPSTLAAIRDFIRPPIHSLPSAHSCDGLTVKA